MAIRFYKAMTGRGTPDVAYYPLGNSFAYLAGDVLGLLSGTSAQTDASPAGTVRRMGASVGGAAASFPLVLASGALGIAKDFATASAAGISTTPAAPSGVNPMFQPKLALPSRSDTYSGSDPVAGVVRSQIAVFLATDNNVFIQRIKKGTRTTSALRGTKCNLTYNATSLEFEVDVAIVANPFVEIVEVPPLYNDNRTYYDSATFATDNFGGWVAFRFLPSVQQITAGTTYAS